LVSAVSPSLMTNELAVWIYPRKFRTSRLVVNGKNDDHDRSSGPSANHHCLGGLDTAAFGLVDATKVFRSGVNNIGFSGIETTVKALTPGNPANALSQLKQIVSGPISTSVRQREARNGQRFRGPDTNNLEQSLAIRRKSYAKSMPGHRATLHCCI